MNDKNKLSVQEELKILLENIKQGFAFPKHIKEFIPKFKAGDILIRTNSDNRYPDKLIISRVEIDRYYHMRHANDVNDETWFYGYQIDKIYTKLYHYNKIWNELNENHL